ncbi:MAG: guanylate kinase [Chlorobiaceae bacterium]|nr:guanylate kinase [Chlorobiaceae bacterium]
MKEIIGKVIVISAPSGTGKTTILNSVLKEFPEIVFSVSATTRAKRNSEKDGVDYYFISEEKFLKMISDNEFLEWEKFYDYYYGTFKKFVEDTIKKGSSVIIEVDVKGAISIKNNYPDASLIFIEPPSVEELINRLKNRNTESESDFNKRVNRAKMELNQKDKFDYFVFNENLEEAIVNLKSLINKIIKE